ncbi:TrmB family transcriptional regulator [Neptunomonas qingdaonensis]|uniref:Sugar-specific transcriptional regulator TrmB n=1 Tax=Neptunomonas qingdaonensis TaxID=1045558 RepID=A0A1I2LMC1_9GAMM|nr:helix-turn-helix domain-containing protein [Neptunomonas qingdaonensis]SFF78186.1 Sugar-specific transcriptional regulator TrmB [Neptunomonas qingdaonensis]
MQNSILERLGFDQREITIYRALLSLGPSPIRSIAEKAGINRGTTYDCLKVLLQKGIVSYLPKGKRRLFSPRDPEVLLQLAEQKQLEISNTIQQLKNSIIPELNHLKPNFTAANVQFYEGDDGIEFVLRDILSSVSQMSERKYSVFSSKPIRSHLYRPFPNYTAQRIQRKIGVRVIAIGEGGEDAELSQRKWIKTEGPVDAAYIAIYPPKCAIISLASNNYPTAVLIDSKEVSTAQQIIFDTLWEML